MSKTPELRTKAGEIVPWGDIVLPIVVIHRDRIYCVGTCFVTSHEGYIFTAKHVFEGTNEAFGTTSGESEEKTNYEAYALWLMKDGKHHVPRPIDKVWMNDSTDICVGWLRTMSLENNVRHYDKSAVLHLLPPQVGDKVFTFAYPQVGINYSEKTINGVQAVDLDLKKTEQWGTVEDVSHEGISLCRWPAFQVNFGVECGASGGPVFNVKGELIGIISTSSEGDNPYTIVSSIWPALGIETQVKFNETAPITTIRILDLVKKGFIVANDSLKYISIVGNPQKLQLYEPIR